MRRLALAPPPAAFIVRGPGGAGLAEVLLRRAVVCAAPAPHGAELLLIAGAVPPAWQAPLRALFETLPLPRAAVWLEPPDGGAGPALPLAARVPVPALEGCCAAPWRGRPAAAQQPLLEDRPPRPWRGRGEHGQGGEGMMGGTPYGRAMAMTGPDPDGLALDALPVHLGPFFPGLADGLQLRLTLQGERITACDGADLLLPRPAALAAGTAGPALRHIAAAMRGERPCRIATLEQERAAEHLLWMARVARLLGLEALALRALRVAAQPERASVRRLLRRAAAGGVLRRALRGRAVLAPEAAAGIGGPAARAAGLVVDARSEDPAYLRLGFVPCTAPGSDLWSRWQVRAGETLAALELAQRASDAAAQVPFEAPGGPVRARAGGWETPSARVLAGLPRWLPGRDWSDAVALLASLGFDAQEAALA